MLEAGTPNSVDLVQVLGTLVRPEVLQRGVWLVLGEAGRGNESGESIVRVESAQSWPDRRTGRQRTRVTGTVQGTDTYSVEVDARGDGTMTCHCTCPYFTDRRVPCKHVVAFIMESIRLKQWIWPGHVRSLTAENARDVGLPQDRRRKRRNRREGREGRDDAGTTGAPPADGSPTGPTPNGQPQQHPNHQQNPQARGPRPGAPNGQPNHQGPQHPGAPHQRNGHSRRRRDHDRGHEFAQGDDWRSTILQETQGQRLPLVYTYRTDRATTRPDDVTIWRRTTDRSRPLQLIRMQLHDAMTLKIDDTDRALLKELDDRAKALQQQGGWLDPSWTAGFARIAAKAGRLHRSPAPGYVGTAFRWAGDNVADATIRAEKTKDGGRIYVKVEVPDGPTIDWTSPGGRRYGSLYGLGDLLVESGPGSVEGFGPVADVLVEGGAVNYRGEEIETLLEDLRNGDWAAIEKRAVRSERVVDPDLGIVYYDAKPEPVLRIDGGPQRATVDVQPLVRYRHPDDEDIVVHRDPRTHQIVEHPSELTEFIPRYDRDVELQIASRGETILRRASGSGEKIWRMPRTQLPNFLATAGRSGFAVETSRMPTRSSGEWSLTVTSGVDWFQLDGFLQTPNGPIPLSALVSAARKHPDAVELLPLDDGSSVVMPAKLQALLRRLAKLWSTRDGGALRFDRSDALFLDALLADAERHTDDEPFRELRDKLASFESPTPKPPPKEFQGTLREYQLNALGWFDGLRQLNFGGCLADEMGLGKTVQVLAMLSARRAEQERELKAAAAKAAKKKSKKKVSKKKVATKAEKGLSSLIVVPRSIVRNWIDEAHRFAPKLKVLDLSHAKRTLDDRTFAKCDVAIMTYGTVLRDVEELAERQFDYVILDEAQAVKTATARTSKAVKCLKANHKLAMTGTPIENHLGELGSLMEFLNPGFGERLTKLTAGDPSDLTLVRRAVHPFILRRTKKDVAKELPDRIEQTLYCDMTEEQQKHYDALLDRMRADLLSAIEEDGLAKSKMQVLEGLLRLRQIACHPVLVDKRRALAGSGKIEALLPMLEESMEEGRKTLVFSQFTSFLALVRKELDERGIVYEYLDGKTKDRAERVARFNRDEKCSVFLLSLKAGGVGLNLQSAERVLLLDPWWNPAVEAQAIDRAHRIGQTRSVHAIRMVSAGTIEERVLALQERKRSLADAILAQDGAAESSAGPLASLTREDLEFLLAKPGETPKAKAKAKKKTVKSKE